MGNYNPRAAYILGEEWVPIRDEVLSYSPSVNTVERGVAFTLATAARPRDARFYVNELPGAAIVYHVAEVNIYPYGEEDQTGPVRELIIPVSSATVTGSAISLVGASSYAQALQNPGDGKYAQFGYASGNLQAMSLWFAVNQYPELANKRILNVSMLYAGNVFDIENTSG